MLSCNHCYSGKAISITYSECVSVALVIQHAMRMRSFVTCGLSRCMVFSPHLINGTIFGGKKVTGHKMCFDFLYKFCLQHFSF